MNVFNKINFSKLALNLLFITLIVGTSVSNHSKNVPIFYVVFYNLLLFIPAYINNFLLLKNFRKNKRLGRYICSVLLLLTAAVFLVGNYINYLVERFSGTELLDYTSIGITSDAPRSLKNFQHLFDVFPGILLLCAVMCLG